MSNVVNIFSKESVEKPLLKGKHDLNGMSGSDILKLLHDTYNPEELEPFIYSIRNITIHDASSVLFKVAKLFNKHFTTSCPLRSAVVLPIDSLANISVLHQFKPSDHLDVLSDSIVVNIFAGDASDVMAFISRTKDFWWQNMISLPKQELTRLEEEDANVTD